MPSIETIDRTDLEADRLLSLRALRIGDEPSSPALDRICEVARNLFGVPLVLLTLLEADAQIVRGASGSFPRCSPRADSFCTHTIRAEEPMIVEDAVRDPRFAENVHVRESGVRFYAGMPISLDAGLRLGAFCVIDTAPRSFSEAETEQLRTFALMAETDLRLRATALRLEEGERRFKALVHASATIVWRMSPSGEMTDVCLQHAFSGADPAGFMGRAFLERVHPDDAEADRRALGACLAMGRTGEWPARLMSPSGEYRWMQVKCVPIHGPDGLVEEWVGSCTDFHDQKLAEMAAWKAANHDALTGLCNRSLFQERLEASLSPVRGEARQAHLLLVDLDNFKEVNDTLGHQAGDELLRHVGAGLTEAVGPAGIVARFGGDEFGVILPGQRTEGELNAVADAVLRRIEYPLSFGDHVLSCHASVGIASYPADGGSAVDLFRSADLAMYAAKGQGRNRARRYEPEMLKAMEGRVKVAAEIREALTLNAIVPHYQPKVCLDTGRVTGFEALARWNHPTRGLLGPIAFASALDDPELSMLVGERMLNLVMADIAQWIRRGADVGRVAVNLSTSHFGLPDLADRLISGLSRNGVQPRHFEVEVTETVFLSRSNAEVARTLSKLHDAGISIALDDFGTGFASLTHLKQFPVDRIKIDRSFVSDIERDPDDAAIVAAIAGLGRNLGIAVVAEGVETEGQASYVRSRGCEEAQGYLYAKPMPAERVEAYLESPLRQAA